MSTYFNSVNMSCIAKTSSINYCQTNSSTTVCSVCITGYYLSNSQCSSCANSISNCIVCSNATTCLSCTPSYYLLQSSTSTTSQCLSCSSYSCSICYSTISEIICLTCFRGYSLFNGNCYQCPDGYRFDILTKSCLSCSSILANCMYC